MVINVKPVKVIVLGGTRVGVARVCGQLTAAALAPLSRRRFPPFQLMVFRDSETLTYSLTRTPTNEESGGTFTAVSGVCVYLRLACARLSDHQGTILFNLKTNLFTFNAVV